ncbi:MBL fold metallo-hydrolase RNA specificity domain-containing protein [Vibrio parahaemolyticus]|nr:MBL fold metallo-hydrolase RNA specificity domain-containing protein [Vibrio parahaemolyticus]
MKFVTEIPTQPQAVHLIHGEKEAKKELGEKLEAEGIEVVC